MAVLKTFQKGDFIKYDYKALSFGIFDGEDLMPEFNYAKKYTLALYYDPSKYCQNDDGSGWGSRPVLEVSSFGKHCEKTVDTDKEDNFWKLCSEEEKELALKKMAEYGLRWDEKKLEIIDIGTEKVLYRIKVPKLEYHGEEVKPISKKLKGKLKKYIMGKNKVATTYPNSRYAYGGYYEDYYD